MLRLKKKKMVPVLRAWTKKERVYTLIRERVVLYEKYFLSTLSTIGEMDFKESYTVVTARPLLRPIRVILWM